MKFRFRTKSIISFLLKVVVFFGIICIFYYLVIMLPLFRSVKALSQVKTTTQEAYFSLSANRVAIIQLARLDPTSLQFNNEKQTILESIKDSQEKIEGLKFQKLNTFWAKTQVKIFIENEFEKDYPDLIEKSKEVVNKQKQILTDFENLDGILANIYIYDPQVDLGSKDKVFEKERLAENSARAIEGLGKISNKLKERGDAVNLVESINYSISSLNEINGLLNAGNISGSQDQINIFIQSYEKLKREAYDNEKSILTSNKNLELIKNETELIDKYEELVSKIENEQKRLLP